MQLCTPLGWEVIVFIFMRTSPVALIPILKLLSHTFAGQVSQPYHNQERVICHHIIFFFLFEMGFFFLFFWHVSLSVTDWSWVKWPAHLDHSGVICLLKSKSPGSTVSLGKTHSQSFITVDQEEAGFLQLAGSGWELSTGHTDGLAEVWMLTSRVMGVDMD